MTATAAKTMAWAPFGHSVTIQKNSIVAIVTNTRTAFTRAGSKSGTLNQAERDPGMFRAGSTSSSNPLSARRMPISASAVLSASSRSDSVRSGTAVRARAAAAHARHTGDGSTGQQECAGKLSGDFGRNRSELGGQPAPRATEIGSCKYDARADDTDADFACAGDGEHKDVVVRAADRAEFVARDDHSRIAGERRRVGCEVAQQRGQQAAPGAPERQPEE